MRSVRQTVLFCSGPHLKHSLGLCLSVRRLEPGNRPSRPNPFDGIGPSRRREKAVDFRPFFDYEGVWSSWTLGSPPLAYPREVARASSSAPAKTREDRVAVCSLLMRPFESIPVAAGSSRRAPRDFVETNVGSLPTGRVSHRVLPDFHQIPSVRGFRPERRVYVTGETRPDRNPAELFGDLLHRAHVAPFLYVDDKERVLVSALSPAPPGNVERHLPVFRRVTIWTEDRGSKTVNRCNVPADRPSIRPTDGACHLTWHPFADGRPSGGRFSYNVPTAAQLPSEVYGHTQR